MIDLSLELLDKSEFQPLELALWHEGGFIKQIRDIYPEVYRLKKYENDEKAFRAQWSTLLELVSMTMLDDGVEEVIKDELYRNIVKLRDYYAEAGMNEATAFGWWKQWRHNACRKTDQPI